MNTLSPDTARRLVGVRALLEQADAESRHRSPDRQRVGVILLDAAVELAAFEAAAARGLKTESETERQIAALQNDGAKLKNGVKEIRRLHSARNKAQHEGLLVHPQDLAAFILAARRFVDELVAEVFSTSIWAVTLADAISDSELRARYVRAADAAASAPPAEAIEAIFEVYNWVRMSMYGFGGMAVRSGGTPSRGSQDEWTKYLADSLTSIEELLLMSGQGVDVVDLLWFQTLVRERSLATSEDVDRALHMVFWLSVEFESSPAALERNRLEEWAREFRKERTGPGPARLATLDVSRSRHGQHALDFEIVLHDIPEAKWRELWRHAVIQHLGVGLQFPSQVRLDDVGRLRGTLSSDVDHAAFRASLDAALLAAEDSVVEEQKAATEREVKLAARRAEFDADFAAHRDQMPDWVESAELQVQRRGPAHIDSIRLSLAPELEHLSGKLREHLLAYDDISQCYFPFTIEPVLSAADLAAHLADFNHQVVFVRKERYQAEQEYQSARDSFLAAFDG